MTGPKNKLYSEIKPLHVDSCMSVQGTCPYGRGNLITVMEYVGISTLRPS